MVGNMCDHGNVEGLYSKHILYQSKERIRHNLHMMDEVLFSEWLIRKMQDKQLTQAQLAQRSRLSDGAIYKLITSQTKQPKLSTLTALANALDVSPETLLMAAGMPVPKPQFKLQYDLDQVVAQLSETYQQLLFDIATRMLKYDRKSEER